MAYNPIEYATATEMRPGTVLFITGDAVESVERLDHNTRRVHLVGGRSFVTDTGHKFPVI